MKKLLIALIVLGLVATGISISNADSTRTIDHKFRSFVAGFDSPNTTSGNVEVSSMTIYRITGYATGSNAVYAFYNSSSESNMANTDVAVEGGEATSGDALLMQDFGEDGLVIPSGTVVRVSNCVVVVEYL